MYILICVRVCEFIHEIYVYIIDTHTHTQPYVDVNKNKYIHIALLFASSEACCQLWYCTVLTNLVSPPTTVLHAVHAKVEG